MVGEKNLGHLLKNMTPELCPDIFVFCSIPANGNELGSLVPLMTFYEQEGKTVLLLMEDATKNGISYQFPCQKITLNVHSSLEAVGFLAQVATVLAAAGISVNAVSAFYHDHLFVPVEKAKEAIELLRNMSRVQNDG